MNKSIGIVVAVVVLVIVGVVGGAYWSGRQAEHWYQEAIAEASKNPAIKVNTLRYERGWFSSQSVTQFQFDMPEVEGEQTTPDPSFSIRQDIYHGPLPLAGWGVPGVPMALTGAVTRATLDPESSDWVRELKKLYGDKEPVEVISKIAFDGTSDNRITMPALTLNNIEDIQNLQFSGLEGQFKVSPRGEAIDGGMTVNSLDITSKPSTPAEGQPASSPVQLKLRALTATTQQKKGAFDLYFGDASTKIGELTVQDEANKTPVQLNNLSIDASAKLSAQNPQQVDVDTVFKADKFIVDTWNGSGALRISFHNLDGATTAKLQAWQQKMTATPADPQMLDELLRLARALLMGKPVFVLDTQAKLNQGDWQGKLTLNLRDFGEVDLVQNPMGLLGALEKGLAEMAVSKSLADQLLSEQLPAMTASGFVRLEGDQYKSVARFEENKLFVNDKEIPLGALGAPTEGALEQEAPLEPDDGAATEEEEAPKN